MRNLGRSVVLGVFIGVVISIVYFLINVFSGESFSNRPVFWQNITYTFIYSIVLTVINTAYFNYINTRIDWKKFRQYRLAIGAAGSILITMMGVFLIRMVISIFLERNDWESFIAGESIGYYTVAFLIVLVVSLAFHAFHFYKTIQEHKVKEHKIIAGTASAKFDALKNQLDPHFLFNSLNVLTSLIDEDPKQAQKFTTSLSKVYRYVLEQKNKDLVPVDEELKFAHTYTELLRMRFEDSIIFEIPERSGNPDGLIVPLSLQLLLENAIKHNVVNVNKPLKLKVYEENGFLVVENNLQEKQVLKKSSGFGLKNIMQRYNILSNREMQITKSENTFSVSLPVLTQQVSAAESQESFIEEKRYQKAKERVEALKGFYGNLTAYCIVIPFLIWLNMRTTDFPWVIFPILGWGFGLTMHGLEAFGYNPIWGKRWEERKIRELMERDDF